VNTHNHSIVVVGLGYVGLPLALKLAERHPETTTVIGYDANPRRVAELRDANDRTGDRTKAELVKTRLVLTDDSDDIDCAAVYIVAVPTPILPNKQPDLQALQSASAMVGRAMVEGALVIYESTVYPGVTNDICVPILERTSGLRRGTGFQVGYSPERINPGDTEHTLETVVKVVSADDPATLERVKAVYAPIIKAGLHAAPSIAAAEAAKVIENTQRDLNIALMNELALIFERLGIETHDVIEAAATKWNFLRFHPGLVGGHCIGVDPYYLTAKAEAVGYHPQVILAGRRINDAMGVVVARKTVKLLIEADARVRGARIGVLGATYKRDVSDVRNSRVPDIIRELEEFGCIPLVHDPLADPRHMMDEHGVRLRSLNELTDLDAVVVAVDHSAYRELNLVDWFALQRRGTGGVLVDIYGAVDAEETRARFTYWRL